MDLPRDNLTRSVPFTLERAAEDGDGLTLEGYGAVFDSPTVIDSWEGRFEEVISRGAFAKTLSERTPVVQFDHGQHPLVGSIPLGSVDEIREDDHGLYIRARLHDNWLVQPVRDAIASGAVDGMSFRFSVVKDDEMKRGKEMPLRTIREVKLYEVGPVVFPAYADTSVGVRSQQIASILRDRTALADLARALILGTPSDEAASGTSDDGAAIPQEPQPHSGMTPDERKRALSILTLEIP